MLPDNLSKPLFNLFDRRAWRYLFRCYQKRGARLLTLSLIAATRSALLIPVLLMIREIFDSAIPQSNVRLLLLLAAGIVAARLISSGILLFMRRLIIRDIHHVIMEMRRDLIEHLYRLNRAYYSNVDRNALHSQLVQDTERVDQMSNALFSAVIPALFTSTVLLFALFVLQWQLTLAACLAVPLIMASTWLSGRRVKTRVKAFQTAFEQFSKGVMFSLRYMRLTQEQAAEDQEARRRERELDELRRQGDAMSFSFLINGQLNENIMGIVGVVVVVTGALAIMTGALSLGEFVAFYAAAGMLNGQLGTLTRGLPDILSGNESLVKLQVLRDVDAPEPYQGQRRIDFSGKVEYRDVSFSYTAEPLLVSINLKIEPSRTLLITGENGAGKSSLLYLLMGFWRPDEGELFADGLSYEELNIGDLRKAIGFVPQRAELIPGSIRENISYGHGESEDEVVMAAVKQATADVFIRDLPNGIETQVGEDGIKLSGGECQKIALARAMISNPALLVLDEPTNHLDTEAVSRILENLRSRKKDLAIVIISHDARVRSYVDQVLQLKDGSLSEIPQ